MVRKSLAINKGKDHTVYTMPRKPRFSQCTAEVVSCRMTIAEKRRIDELARAAGQSVSDWLRAAVEMHVARAERARRGRG